MANPRQSNNTKLRVVVLNRRSIVAVLLLVCLVWLITSNTFWRWMYPIGFQPTIQQAAHESDVDPLLVASVIRVESKFKSDNVSHAGAIGLMQLMPDTAQWIATKMAESGTPVPSVGNAAELAGPTLNIRLGSWYIHYLKQKFNGNQVAAIAAYNAGPKRVQEWLSDGIWNGELQTIDRIPVGETRHFVDRVYYNYDLYKRIYGNDAEWKISEK